MLAQVTYHVFENPTEDNIWLGKNSGLVLGLLKASINSLNIKKPILFWN
jgi:hypothetical protein